jgi:hypothetical protein
VITVWKFPIEATETQAIQMPRGAKLLHVAAQGEGLRAQPCVWVLCDTEAPRTFRTLAVVGTGHHSAHVAELPHVGSFLLGHGELVFHVFDMGEA